MYKEALRPSWVEVDLGNLDTNIKAIRRKLGPHPKIIGVVKADAYGHGALQTAEILKQNGVHDFAVATLSEAITLRKGGIDDTILILGLTPDMYADTVADYELTPVFCSFENAKAFDAAARTRGITLEGFAGVDTGMGRIGYAWNDTDRAVYELRLVRDELKNFKLGGMISHFATADETHLTFAEQQAERFASFGRALDRANVEVPMKTIANSAAIMRMPKEYYDGARPGIILYGLYPSNEVDRTLLPLRPVMSVKANIVWLKDVDAGFSVGYGRKYISEGPAKIATVNIGYADGLPRPWSKEGQVIVNGILCPIAGNICMDQFMVDVTHVPGVKVGDEVTVMGTDRGCTITAEDIARATGTISYEITCAFGQRLPKVFIR